MAGCTGQVVGWPDTVSDTGVDTDSDTDTTGDVTAPTVVTTVPADTETEVAVNSVVLATFSETMDPLTVTGSTFTLMDGTVPVEGEVTLFDRTALFVPDAVLDFETEYTGRIGTGVTDLASNPLAADYVWTFTTGDEVDTTAPYVVFTRPEDTEEGVPVDEPVFATFSESMDPTTITDATFELAGPGGSAVTGEVVYDDASKRATFTPDDLLLEDTTYTASISTEAEDLADNGLEEEHVWTFTTGEPPFLPPPVDLGILSSFVAVAGVSIDNSGPTYLNGDVGLSPGSSRTASTPPDMYITGTLYVNDPEGVAAEAKADLTDALIEAQGLRVGRHDLGRPGRAGAHPGRVHLRLYDGDRGGRHADAGRGG